MFYYFQKFTIHSLADKMKELGWMLSCVQVTFNIQSSSSHLKDIEKGSWAWICTGMLMRFTSITKMHTNTHCIAQAPTAVQLYENALLPYAWLQIQNTHKYTVLHRPQQQCTCTLCQPISNQDSLTHFLLTLPSELFGCCIFFNVLFSCFLFLFNWRTAGWPCQVNLFASDDFQHFLSETAKLVANPGELTGRAAVYGMAQKIPQ